MPTNILTFFASEAAEPAESGNVFDALGIEWQMLLFQMIGFLILVWLMGKFVYPILIRAVDKRQETIEEGAKAAQEAEAKAQEAEAKIEATLKKARTEAADIVSTAKTEATQMIEKAENQAKTRSERIVAEAQEEIAKDVIAARRSLEKETVSLVKQAASLAVSEIADDKLDTALVKKSIEGAKK